MYTVDWVGTISLGLLQQGRPSFAFAVEEGQGIPSDFKVGDEVLVENHPADHASVTQAGDCGYCEVKHVASGTTIRIIHRIYEHIFR